MNRFVFLGIFFVLFTSCNKEPANEPQYLSTYRWSIAIRLIDKDSNLLFPEYPPNYAATTFDPRASQYLTGEGILKKMKFSGNPAMGLLFTPGEHISALRLDSNYQKHKKLIWTLYFKQGEPPIILEVRNPHVYAGHGADLILCNNDTLYDTTDGPPRWINFYDIIYP